MTARRSKRIVFFKTVLTLDAQFTKMVALSLLKHRCVSTLPIDQIDDSFAQQSALLKARVPQNIVHKSVAFR